MIEKAAINYHERKRKSLPPYFFNIRIRIFRLYSAVIADEGAAIFKFVFDNYNL